MHVFLIKVVSHIETRGYKRASFRRALCVVNPSLTREDFAFRSRMLVLSSRRIVSSSGMRCDKHVSDHDVARGQGAVVLRAEWGTLLGLPKKTGKRRVIWTGVRIPRQRIRAATPAGWPAPYRRVLKSIRKSGPHTSHAGIQGLVMGTTWRER